jgi:hypothetical protein
MTRGGCCAGRQHALEFAARDDVEAAAGLCQHLQDGQRGVGLHGVADAALRPASAALVGGQRRQNGGLGVDEQGRAVRARPARCRGTSSTMQLAVVDTTAPAQWRRGQASRAGRSWMSGGRAAAAVHGRRNGRLAGAAGGSAAAGRRGFRGRVARLSAAGVVGNVERPFLAAAGQWTEPRGCKASPDRARLAV